MVQMGCMYKCFWFNIQQTNHSVISLSFRSQVHLWHSGLLLLYLTEHKSEETAHITTLEMFYVVLWEV